MKYSALLVILLISLIIHAETTRDPFQKIIKVNSTNNQSVINPTALPTKLFKIRYAKAEDLANLLRNQKGGLLSKTGQVSADSRTNALWVQDTDAQLAMITRFIMQLDIPVQQVLIKARIVNISDSYLQELGVRFGTVSSNTAAKSLQNGHFSVALAKLGDDNLLDVELSTIENAGEGKIISSPELITANRTMAYIQAGEEVPYQSQTKEGGTSVAFKKAILGLKVTPQITPDRKIMLYLTINQDQLSNITVNGVPAIQTREMQTQVLVKHGQTIALGGIYEQSDAKTRERIPWLASVPVVGNLFRSKTTQKERRQLVVFITPRILD